MRKLFRSNYNNGSGAELFRAIGLQKALSQGNPLNNTILINWGLSTNILRESETTLVLNEPHLIKTAISKQRTQELLKYNNIKTIEITHNRNEAKEFLEEDGFVLHRIDFLSEGKGISLVESEDHLPIINDPDKEFYVRYYKHSHEFRVHVFNNRVIDVVQKKKMSSQMLEERNIIFNPHIRNHDNGWVFAREDINLPNELEIIALKTLKASGLFFGAIDIAANINAVGLVDYRVLEINTAPGLTETTFDNYKAAFEFYLSQFN